MRGFDGAREPVHGQLQRSKFTAIDVDGHFEPDHELLGRSLERGSTRDLHTLLAAFCARGTARVFMGLKGPNKGGPMIWLSPILSYVNEINMRMKSRFCSEYWFS